MLAADVLRLGLAGVGALNVLTTLYYAATWNPLNFPLELLSNGFTFLLPAADLLLNGRLKVRIGVVCCSDFDHVVPEGGCAAKHRVYDLPWSARPGLRPACC